MSRFDVVRSLLREATAKVRDRAAAALPLDRLREIASDVRDRRVRIPEHSLTRAIAHASDVEEASARVQHGAIYIEARGIGASEPFEARIRPEVRAFAPRGAKELAFRVEPEAAASHLLAAEIAQALSGLIAAHLWVSLAHSADEASGAFVEREFPATFRVDLRTVPAVRAALEGPAGLLVETLAPSRIEAEDGALSIHLALPSVFGP